jgi:hypothetical protein
VGLKRQFTNTWIHTQINTLLATSHPYHLLLAVSCVQPGHRPDFIPAFCVSNRVDPSTPLCAFMPPSCESLCGGAVQRWAGLQQSGSRQPARPHSVHTRCPCAVMSLFAKPLPQSGGPGWTVRSHWLIQQGHHCCSCSCVVVGAGAGALAVAFINDIITGMISRSPSNSTYYPKM